MTTGLVDRNGNPLSSKNYARTARPKPIVGEAFGSWTGRDQFMYELPGGGYVQFDLSKLTLADFRGMKTHYQVNASLSLLSFMIHQSDWHIECDDAKIVTHVESNMRNVWSRLVRAMSQAFWAGYSPNVLQWENDDKTSTVQLEKIKDLIPEECDINWKEVEGYIPPDRRPGVAPKFKVYDGIRQIGAPWPIPVRNSLWYPLLMENGNMYGRQLLKAAYTPYFFSMLMHLFANRYYERFGEPVPIGRAPWDSEVEMGGTRVRGNEAMATILSNLRNRSTVVLPADIDQETKEFDYQIEYLESQMRGADFERYMTRLDEEISLALFTPLLMMRTADIGSYNLGVGHTQVYLWLLNAILADLTEYINKYILSPMVDFNFGEKAPRARIAFRKLGTKNEETIRAIITELIRKGAAKVDVVELGESLGMKVEEVEVVTEPAPVPTDPSTDPTADPKKDTRGPRDKPKVQKGVQATSKVLDLIYARVLGQLQKAEKDGTQVRVDLGYLSQLSDSLVGRVDRPSEVAGVMHSRFEAAFHDILTADLPFEATARDFSWYLSAISGDVLGEPA